MMLGKWLLQKEIAWLTDLNKDWNGSERLQEVEAL